MIQSVCNQITSNITQFVISYEESTKSLTVQSFSFADAGTYNLKIQYKLANYPTVTSSIPLTVKIQIPPTPTLPITISPKPVSTYTLAPGDKLTLVFEISDPQNVEIAITVDTGSAKAFAITEI